MRKSSTEIYREVVIDRILSTAVNREEIEKSLYEMRCGRDEKFHLEYLLDVVAAFPELKQYIYKELADIHDVIIRRSGLTEEAFDRELRKLEEL